jgi:hypothetical protein
MASFRVIRGQKKTGASTYAKKLRRGAAAPHSKTSALSALSVAKLLLLFLAEFLESEIGSQPHLLTRRSTQVVLAG